MSSNNPAHKIVRCPCCGHPIPEEDVRPVPPRWSEIVELVEGARARGWSEEQVNYLRAAIGIAWTKAFRRGELHESSYV